MQLAIEIVRDGEGAARAGRIEVTEAATPGRGRAGRPRDRQLAAGQDRALRPRPQLGPDRPGGRRGAGRRGPGGDRRRDRSTPPSSAPTSPRPRSACGSAAASTAPTSGSPTSATSTSRSTRSTRRETTNTTYDTPARQRQRRHPARGAALHPRVPRPHGGDQVRRRGDARRGAARSLRHRRRPAQVRRPQPGDRPRRRPRDHPLHGETRPRGALPRGPAGLRRGDGRGGEDGPGRQAQLGNRPAAEPPRPAGGRALRRGRDPVRGRAGRQRRAGRLRRLDRAGRRRRPQPHRRRLHPGDRLLGLRPRAASPTTSTPTRRPARSPPRSAPTRRSSSPTSRAGSPTPTTRGR